MKQVIIHTDGACVRNPGGASGWATVLHCVSGGRQHEKILHGGFRSSTNNRMEMFAALQGLLALRSPCKIELVTDSQIVIWGIKGLQIGRMPKANVDLWLKIRGAMSGHRVSTKWVKGHSGHPLNELCDRLASRACRGNLEVDLAYEKGETVPSPQQELLLL